MTDAERLEEWYRKQGILQGVEFHFTNIYENYYMLYTVEPKLYGCLLYTSDAADD